MKTLLASLLILVITGCSSLRPVVDQTRYFVLSPAPRQQSLTNLTIGINNIEVPEYLRRRELAWRSGEQEIHYASNLQWAEPLEKMIGRVLASEIGAVLSPNYRRGEVQAEITISFSHFESDEAGMVTLEAAWTIRNPSGNPAYGHANLSSQGPVLLKDPVLAVAELSTRLAHIATEIQKSLEANR